MYTTKLEIYDLDFNNIANISKFIGNILSIKYLINTNNTSFLFRTN
jgi:hypothetical protein